MQSSRCILATHNYRKLNHTRHSLCSHTEISLNCAVKIKTHISFRILYLLNVSLLQVYLLSKLWHKQLLNAATIHYEIYRLLLQEDLCSSCTISLQCALKEVVDERCALQV